MAVAVTNINKPSEHPPIKRAEPLASRAETDALKTS